MTMLNDLNNLIKESGTITTSSATTQTYKVRENVVTVKRNDFTEHPSYLKGMEKAFNEERGGTPYEIDYNLPEHLIAFALGYNAGLLDNASFEQ